MSCTPLHFEGPPDTVHNTPEDIERNWESFRKANRVDPRAIRRQHRWKAAHEPDYDEPESGWVYTKIEFENPSDPDQRDMLTGGPESGLPCERCGEMTRVAGKMSLWDLYHQPGVAFVNEEDTTEGRKRELQKEFIVILACPKCKLKTQFFEELIPSKVQS